MNAGTDDPMNEAQSLKVIREMIEVSRSNFNNDGILFIVWGWIFFICALLRFLLRALVTTHEIAQYTNLTLLVLLISGTAFSIIFIYKRQTTVSTYTGQILRYLWGAIIFLNLYILIYQIRAGMDIDWLLSQYMLMLALGTFVTGGIIRFKPLIYGSISFILLAQISVILLHEMSILIAALSFITGLVIPGHLLYSKRRK